MLTYVLTGDLSRVIVPEPGPRRRTDGLWRSTCLEAFIAGTHWPAYREFNFAPSGDWAAYDFRAYRAGSTPAPIGAPALARDVSKGALRLRVTLRPEHLPAGDRLRIGLAAVLEDIDGRLGYRALRHPAGPPDFHHRDGFAIAVSNSDGFVAFAARGDSA